MTATSKRSSGALIHPALDFLMLGGLSLLIPLLHFYPLFNDPLVSNKLGWAAFYLAFVVNNPHFMHSYQLFYRGFPHKMHAMSRASQIRYLLAGVIVPFALLNGILAGGMVGATMFLGYLVNLMFFLVGWHYAKQGFGILVVMAGRKGLFFQAIERKILLVNAYTIWALTWVKTNIVAQDHNYYGIPYATFDLPDILGPVTMAAGGLTTAATLYVFFRLWMREKTLPVSGVIGYLAPIYLWLGFWNLNSAAFVFIPALHSLQYLPFVWRIEKERRAARPEKTFPGPRFGTVLFFLSAVFTGVVFFYLAPYWVDQKGFFDAPALGLQFGFFGFIIFINIHHYFLDHALWRRDNPEMALLA